MQLSQVFELVRGVSRSRRVLRLLHRLLLLCFFVFSPTAMMRDRSAGRGTYEEPTTS